jgi:hypothetical protein
MIAIDTLVHNFLHRTGILARFGADHLYGAGCYRPGGCADIITLVAAQIDARAFNPAFPAIFPRFVQHAIWRYCAQLIAEGAQVEGDVVAEELTISGHVEGTIRANRVKLNSTAVVDGDIFHRSLAIEENAQFEGASRRLEDVIETSSRVQTNRYQPQTASIDSNASASESQSAH